MEFFTSRKEFRSYHPNRQKSKRGWNQNGLNKNKIKQKLEKDQEGERENVPGATVNTKMGLHSFLILDLVLNFDSPQIFKN